MCVLVVAVVMERWPLYCVEVKIRVDVWLTAWTKKSIRSREVAVSESSTVVIIKVP